MRGRDEESIVDRRLPRQKRLRFGCGVAAEGSGASAGIFAGGADDASGPAAARSASNVTSERHTGHVVCFRAHCL